MSLIWNLATFE